MRSQNGDIASKIANLREELGNSTAFIYTYWNWKGNWERVALSFLVGTVGGLKKELLREKGSNQPIALRSQRQYGEQDVKN